MNAHQRRTALRWAVRENETEERRKLSQREIRAVDRGWWWQLNALGWKVVLRPRHVRRFA